MKKITNYKLQVTRIAFCLLLSAFCLIANAQTNESFILSAEDVQKNELKITPELEKMVVKEINNMPESYLSTIYGINKKQLENLHLGKPIPWYKIVNEKLEPVFAPNVHRLAEGKTLSLRFTNKWNVPVMSAGEPLVFVFVGITESEYTFMGIRPLAPGTENPTKHIYNYEHKDWLIGAFEATPSGFGLDFLIIKKEDKDIFVEIYDEATGEYFKNEYGSGELITLLTDLFAKIKAKQSRYYDFVADKSELILTPELTELLRMRVFDHIESWPDEHLLHFGITNRPKLENLHPGKPVPRYSIVNENLTFTGRWDVPVMADGEPFYTSTVKLEDNGQYSYAGGGTANYEVLNYKDKDLLIGYLNIGRTGYLIIRKDNKDIFVKFDIEATGEVLKTEYSLSELINLLKK